MGINTDVTALRYFAHVAATRSFVRGAERARVSAPAISKAIRKLEEDLGTQLFERTTRRVFLTPAGEIVLARCRRVLAELDGLDGDLANAAGRVAGPLRIAAMEVFSIELLPRALAELVSAHPEVVPSSYEMIPQQMNERLAAGDLDVGFTVGATPMPGLDLHPLGDSRGLLVCGKGHALYARGMVKARDLMQHPSVAPRFYGAEHLPGLDQFPESQYPRKIGATIELLQMGLELVASGQYLGFFPEVSLRGPLATGRLRALRGLRFETPFALHAISRAAVPLKPAVVALIDAVKTAMSRPSASRARRSRPNSKTHS